MNYFLHIILHIYYPFHQAWTFVCPFGMSIFVTHTWVKTAFLEIWYITIRHKKQRARDEHHWLIRQNTRYDFIKCGWSRLLKMNWANMNARWIIFFGSLYIGLTKRTYELEIRTYLLGILRIHHQELKYFLWIPFDMIIVHIRRWKIFFWEYILTVKNLFVISYYNPVQYSHW